jgi:hypothetical protein
MAGSNRCVELDEQVEIRTYIHLLLVMPAHIVCVCLTISLHCRIDTTIERANTSNGGGRKINMAQQGMRYFFILSALLIIVLYFVGASTVGAAFAHMIQTISYAVTGRTNTGATVAYPTGATISAGVLS